MGSLYQTWRLVSFSTTAHWTRYTRSLCYPYTTRTQSKPPRKEKKQQGARWAPDQPVYGTVEEVHKDHWKVHLDGRGAAKLPETQWIRNPTGKGAREVFYIQSMEDDLPSTHACILTALKKKKLVYIYIYIYICLYRCCADASREEVNG